MRSLLTKFGQSAALALPLLTSSGLLRAAEPEIELDVTMSVIEDEDEAEAKLVSEIVIPRSAVAGEKSQGATTDTGMETSSQALESGREFGQQRAAEARQEAAAAKEIKESKKENRPSPPRGPPETPPGGPPQTPPRGNPNN